MSETIDDVDADIAALKSDISALRDFALNNQQVVARARTGIKEIRELVAETLESMNVKMESQ